MENGVVTNGPDNPIWQGRIWDSTVHSHSLAITSIVSTTLVVDGVFGFTRTDMLARPHTDDCWGEVFDIPNTCQPPYGRSTAFPAMNASTLVDLRRRRAARVSRPAMGREPERRLDQERNHNVKFGGELKRLHQNHYETQSPQFTFSGGRTALGPTGSPNNFNAFADFLLGEANSRRSEIMTPMIGIEQTGDDFRPGTLRTWQFGTYIRDQFELNTQDDGVGRRAVGVLPVVAAARPRSRGVRFRPRDSSSSAAKPEFRKPAASRWKRISSRPGSAGHIAPPTRRSFASATRAIRRMTRRAENRCRPLTRTRRRSSTRRRRPITYTAIGTLAQGFPMVPVLDLTVGRLNPVNAGLTTYPLNEQFVRGKISSWNVSMQQLLPYEPQPHAGLCRKSPERPHAPA